MLKRTAGRPTCSSAMARLRSTIPFPGATSGSRNPPALSSMPMSLTCALTARGPSAAISSIGSSGSAALLPKSMQAPKESLEYC